MQEENTEFLPDIDDYLDKNDQTSDINLKNLEELIYIVRSKTALSYEQCEILIKEIFSNIRNEIIKENDIILNDIGRFYINNQKSIKFYITKSIRRRINGK